MINKGQVLPRRTVWFHVHVDRCLGHPTVWQTSLMGVSQSRISFEASVIFFRSITGLRPPLRPLALAASGPAIVLSRMTSRSNSATEPTTWKSSSATSKGTSYSTVTLLARLRGLSTFRPRALATW